MMDWAKFSAVATSIIFILLIGSQLKRNPEMLSKANLNKSLGTMGMLALALIGFVGFLVLMLKSTS